MKIVVDDKIPYIREKLAVLADEVVALRGAEITAEDVRDADVLIVRTRTRCDEGLLSGRLFNNRLLFNGQFGYRDNINTNSQSFIGDFSVQYLLTKSGTISLKVYNQTNDRYFTRNSLDTQGIGVVFQKEFGK